MKKVSQKKKREPRIGDIVNYVMPDGKIRPAVIVEVWTAETVNLQVFTDQLNDQEKGIMWATSRTYDREKAPHTWHFRDG